MQNRNKFRAVINCDLVNESTTPMEDYQKLAFLYDFVLNPDGSINISDESLITQLESQGFTEIEIEYVLDWYGTYDEDWCTNIEPLALQQCTGKADKNGKLIYEGDFVKEANGAIYSVIWDDNFAEFYLLIENSTNEPLARMNEADELEILPDYGKQLERIIKEAADVNG